MATISEELKVVAKMQQEAEARVKHLRIELDEAETLLRQLNIKFDKLLMGEQ